MDTGDVLYRVSGGAMVLSGLFNGLMSLVWVLSFIWVCIGVLWLIPLALAVCNVIVGVLMLATGRQFKLAAFAPVMGLISSVCNFNIMGGVLDVTALGLGIGGFVAGNQADALEDRGF